MASHEPHQLRLLLLRDSVSLSSVEASDAFDEAMRSTGMDKMVVDDIGRLLDALESQGLAILDGDGRPRSSPNFTPLQSPSVEDLARGEDAIRPQLYAGQCFEFWELPDSDGNVPPTDRWIRIKRISAKGNVLFQMGVADDPSLLERELHSIPVERVALLRQMGVWRTNTARFG